MDPVREEVQVFRSPFTPRVLTGEDVLEGGDVLPAFCVRVTEVFEL